VGDKSHSIVISELTWGENLDSFSQPFEVVLGADIVYVEETFPDLIHTIEHLSNSHTITLIAARIRYERDSTFFILLRRTFAFDEVHHDVVRNVTIFSAKKLC